MEKSKSSKKLVIALVVIIVAIVVIGIAVFKGSTGSSAPAADPKDAAEQILSENSALESDEYKAALEYSKYFDTLTDEETDKLMEESADAIYEAPEQVKKLCKKYDLKYSTKSEELTSWTEVEQALKDRSFTEIFSEDLMQALKTSSDSYGGGYSLDEGNLYLEIEEEKENNATALITLDITPEGVFPWQESIFEIAKGDESGKTIFTYKAANDQPFSCVIDGWEGTAFGKAGGYYISIVVSNQTASETEDAAALTQADMESYLERIDFTKFM